MQKISTMRAGGSRVFKGRQLTIGLDLVVCPVYNFTELPSSFSPWAGWIPV